MKNLILFILFFTGSLSMSAQNPVSLSDDGSTVVVSGLVLIFLGFFFFLWRTERRLSKLEKDGKK